MKIIIKLLFTAVLLLSQIANAQEPRPKWEKNRPNGYFCGVGIGKTQEEAIAKAKDDAIINSLPIIIRESFHTGKINRDSIDIIIESDINHREQITTSDPICVSEGIKVYALMCFVDKKDLRYNYSDDPDFKKELKEWNEGVYAFSPRVFIPGLAQIHKGSKTKGYMFIAGEAALVGGIVTAESLRSSYNSKVRTTHDKQYYANKADDCLHIRNGLIAGAAAVYLWNVIDGIAAKGEKRCGSSNNFSLNVTPFTEMDAGGVTFALTF